MGKDCRVPRCNKCRRFGHIQEDCVKTYATVTFNRVEEERPEVMDEAEAEDASAAPAVPAAASQEKTGAGSTLEDASAQGQDKGQADDVKANEEQGKNEDKETDDNTEAAQFSEQGTDAVRETAAMKDVEVQKAKRSLEKDSAVLGTFCPRNLFSRIIVIVILIYIVIITFRNCNLLLSSH